MYINKLNDIVKKYNKKYHRIIKMKPVDEKLSTCLTLVRKLMIKVLNLKLVIIVRISKYKIIYEKGYTPKWSEEVFVIKILCRGYMLLMILT